MVLQCSSTHCTEAVQCWSSGHSCVTLDWGSMQGVSPHQHNHTVDKIGQVTAVVYRNACWIRCHACLQERLVHLLCLIHTCNNS